MTVDQPLVSRVAGDVITGLYKGKRLTQEELAERSGIPVTTLQKKLRGKAPITATDLVMLSRAMKKQPADVMTAIMQELEEAELLTSEGIANIADHRRRRTPADMSDEEMEGESSAANTDPELGHDEPPTT